MSTPDSNTEAPVVLVVDDEDGIRQALDRFLTRLGYRVVDASSGSAALERIAADQPQAMLCDIRMPHMTGVELVPKALAADPDLAIVMLTAIDEPRTAIECMKLGAYDYLIKPVDLDELELSLLREVAVRTRDLEERTAAIQDVALDALAAAGDWSGLHTAAQRLAGELGMPAGEVEAEIRKRRR